MKLRLHVDERKIISDIKSRKSTYLTGKNNGKVWFLEDVGLMILAAVHSKGDTVTAFRIFKSLLYITETLKYS